MSMKCRCGSDDKLVLKSGAVVRKVDHMPHICIGETKPTNFSNDEFLKNKQNEITHQSDKPKAESIITKYTKQQDNILIEIEDALIQQTPSLKTNVQKLGMKMKIIYQCMPTGVKSTSAKMQDDGMVI